MPPSALPVLAWTRRTAVRAAAALLGLVAVLYAWPLVDGASSAFGDVDRLLQIAAATALGVAASVACWRSEGRERHALVAVAAGAELWACVRAVHLGLDLIGPNSARLWLHAVAAGLLCAGAVTGLWLLRRPVPTRRWVRTALEWGLLAAAVVVLLVLVSGTTSDGAVGALWAVAAALLGAAAVLTALRRHALDRPWLLLPVGLGVAAAGIATLGVLDRADALARLPGALVTGGLAVAALGVLVDGADADAADVPARRRGAAAAVLCAVPLLALAAVGLVLLEGAPPAPLALVAAVLVGALGYARLQLLAVEARADARELAAAEAGLRHRAFHDELTGLANRALFMDRLARALDVHRRHRLPLSVLYGDLDGFKHVNDVHGHAAGDELLIAVAERFRACLRPEDTLARLGGDEFVLLLEHGSAPDVVAGRLADTLRDPFVTSAGPFRLSMSTGIAQVLPEDPTPSSQQLLARADAQMYAAKQRARAAAGRPSPVPAQDVRRSELSRAPVVGGGDARRPEPPPVTDASLAAALGAALHGGGVHVVYQPVVDPVTGDVRGLEALARWTHEGLPVPPSRFVDLAERFGLAAVLTDVVLEQAGGQLRQWSDVVGHDRLTMAVNVSPGQLADPTLAGRVAAVLERHRLSPGQLVLETTVDALGSRSGALNGVPLSVGGFTGGAADFALLNSLPVRSVKLDGRPRDAAATVEGDRLLRVLVALGRELDLRVVVERVERAEELAPLRTLAGVLAQGNLLSRPVDAGLLDELVRHGCPLPS